MLTRLIAFALLVVSTVLIATADSAAVAVTGAWARATPPGLDVSAAYFVIENRGAADRLTAVSSPVAGRAELHRTTTRDGMARMEHQHAVAVPPGRTEFAPGGLHVMLLGLEQPLRAGDRFPLTLEFERAGELTVEVSVRAAGGAGHGHGNGHGHSDGHGHGG